MTNLEEIKNRLNIVDIVQEYLPLKKAGTNWKAPCPFHHEKSPSFMVSETKQIWHCFGCGEGGDIFGFVMKIDGVEFAEALKILAKKAGIELKHEDPKFANLKTRTLEISEQAANFFHAYLLKSTEAESAREYLKRRGLTDATIEEFQIGLSPNMWEELIRVLVNKGYKTEELVAAGLAIKSDRRQDSYYDRFRHRIMFPITDAAGGVRGFTGRLLPEDEKKPDAGGKYMNTPETIIYNKGHIIYGLDKAKLAAKSKNEIVVVEGQMDVIASHQAGAKNVVASSGTAFTPEQFKMLKRYVDTILLSFDADNAGETATYRGINEALAAGFNVKIIAIDKSIAKDADELIRKDPKLWEAAIAGAEHIMEFYIKKAKEKFDLSRVDQKSKAINFILNPLSHIPNEIERNLWRKKIAENFDVDEATLGRSLKPHRDQTSVQPAGNIPLADRHSRLSEQVLILLLAHPPSIAYVAANLDPKMLTDGPHETLYRHLIIFYNDTKATQSFSVERFADWLKTIATDASLFKLFDYLLLGQDHYFADLSLDRKLEEQKIILRELRNHYFNNEKKKIEREMREAEARHDVGAIEVLTHRFNELLNIQKFQN